MSLNNSKYCNIRSYWGVLSIMIMSLLFCYFVDGEQAVKDKSVVKYVNSKYLANVEVIMFRRRNSGPYKTNMTVTYLHAWGPNVTIVVSYPIQGGKMFNISVKGCESVDKLWMMQVLHQFTNITECPAPLGTYRYFNLGPIPKAFPSPAPSVPKGSSNTARIEVSKTSTKERMFDVYVHVHVRK